MTDRPRIIVVDDDASICKALQRLLRTAQMDVETFSSGEKFLLALDHNPPACLILDVRMPGMTGPQLRDRLHSMGYSFPIVFITAHAEDIEPERGLPGRVAEVLRKPFDDTALLDAIGRAIQRGEVK
jgi:FixJ family two-component response regulator